MQKKQTMSKRQQKRLKQQQKEHKKEQQQDDKSKEGQSQQKQLNQNQSEDIDFNHIQKIDDQQVQKIDVTFLIAQIREEYYHSMKTVLLRYGQIVSLTQSQIASQVLQKGNQGNVVVAEDDQQSGQDDQNQQDQDQDQQDENDQLNVYSILTILPSSSKTCDKIRKLAMISLEKHKSNIQKSYTKINQILGSSKGCNLLVSSRLPNLPSFIINHSHEIFAQDMKKLKSHSPKNPIFQAEYVLSISQVQISNQSLSLDDLIFSKFQDYEFCKKSVGWWVGENVKSQRTKADLRRLYFVISLKDYYNAVKNIKSYLEDQDQQNVQNE